MKKREIPFHLQLSESFAFLTFYKRRFLEKRHSRQDRPWLQLLKSTIGIDIPSLCLVSTRMNFDILAARRGGN